jgi:hypothetical protein
MSPESRDAMRKDSARDEDPEGEGEASMDPNEMIQAAVTAALGPLMERVSAIETSLSGMAEEMDDVRDPDDTVTTDAIARAEILKPGFKLPTFDAKPGSRAQREAVIGFQRQVLSEAFNTSDGRAAIAPLVNSARPNFQTMSAGEVGVVFRAASERMRDAANARIVTALPTRIVDGERKTFDNKAWNDKNKQFWKRA